MKRSEVILSLGLAALVAACDDGARPRPTCEILSPSNGSTITPANDVNPALDDIQIDIPVRTTNLPSGGLVELFVEGGTNVAPQRPTSTDGTHVFGGVTLPRGPTQTKLTCHIVGTEAMGSVVINVAPSCSLRFVAPIPGQTIARADTRPGIDGRPTYTVVVEGSGLEAGSPVSLEVGEAGQLQTTRQATLSPTRATFDVPVYHGANTRFFARAQGTFCSPSAEIRANVDLGQCTTTLSPPSGTSLVVADDLSPPPDGQSGLQTRVCLQTECIDNSNAFLRIDDGVEVRATVENAMACWEITLGEGSHELSARVEGPQQTGVAPVVTYCVDLTPPTVTVDFPTEGVILSQAQDRDPGSPEVMDILVQGTTAGTATPACALPRPRDQVQILVSDAVQDSFAPTPDGTFSRPIRLPQGPNTVQVCVTDAAGNRTCSAKINVVVDLQIPTLRIETPASGARILRADDVDPATDVSDFDVVVRTTDLPVGTPVTLEIDHGKWLCTSTVERAGSDTVARIRVGPPGCPGMRDGTYRLRARASDQAGNATQSQEVVVTVDNHPPTLAFTAPADGAYVSAATVDVILATNAEDFQPILLRVGNADPLVGVALGGGAVFQGVALQPGANFLQADVADLAGNTTSASITVVRDTTPPAPVFVNLSDGQVLRSSEDKDQNLSNGFQYDVRVALGSEPASTRATLQVGNRTPVAGAVDAQGMVTFAVDLAEGSNPLRVVARDAAGNIGSASLTVVVQTGRPEVTIAVPIDGAALSGNDDLDPSEPGFQLGVSVTSNAPAPVLSCLVVVDPGPSQVVWSLNTSGSSCSGVVTLSEGPHVLVATLESQGQAGRSLPTRVAVDTRAPTLRFLEPLPPANPLDPVVFNAASIDTDGRPGFQTRVVVQADDIEEGQSATLLVIPEGGGTPVATRAVFDAQGRATFPAVTLPDQRRSTLQVTATDRAGNASAAAALSVVVDRQRPAIRILSPRAGDLFGAAADESTAEGFQKTVTVEVSGIEPGQVVTLAVAPPNDGAPTSTLTAQVAAGQTQVIFPRVTLQIPPSGIVVLTATTSDRQGNSALDCIAITVDLVSGEILWFSPPATPSPTLFCGSQDIEPDRPGFQASVTLRVTGFVNGSPVVVRDAQGTEVGRGVVASGNAFVTVTLPDGDHVLRATVIDAAGNSATTTDTRTVRVDTQGPVAVTLDCPADVNGDGFLNRAEDGNPTTTSLFEMTCTVTFSDASANGRQVRILSTAPAPGTSVGTATASGQTASVPVALVAGAAPIGHALTVSASDACNNPSTGPARFNGTVDLVPPNISITMPASGPLLAANDKVPPPPPENANLLECCVGPGGPFDITAQVEGGVGQATLKVNGVVRTQAAIGPSGVVSFPNVALAQGQQSLVVEAQDAAGNLGASVATVVQVDSIAPSISITSLNPAPDQNGNVASNLVDVVVSYSNVEVGRTIRIFSGASVVGSGSTSAGGSSTIPTALVQGPHALQAEVSDVSGNVSRSATVHINVTTSNPVVLFSVPSGNPAIFNRMSGTVTGNQVSLDLVILTTAPAGSTAYLLRDGVEVASAPVVATGGQLASATFPGQVFAHGAAGSLRARVRLSGSLDQPCPGDAFNFCSVLVPFSVDLVAPTLSFTDCTAFLNAQRDEPGDPPGRFRFNLASDAEGQTVSVTSSTSGTVTATVSGGIAAVGPLQLPEGPQTLTATVSDMAGNPTTTECTTQVDITPPATAALSATRSPTRRARVTLSWTMPGDDGNGGTAASYEIRQRLCDPGLSSCIASEADFNAAQPVPNAPPLQPGGTAISFDVDLVTLDRTYTFALRAVDDAGNASGIAAAALSTAFLTDTPTPGPVAGEQRYGNALAVADVDGDGRSDLIVGRPLVSTSGGIRILYGDGKPATDVLASSLGLAGSAFFGRNVANAGDVDGDGFDDVLVGAPTVCPGTDPGTRTGTAFLFFGGPSGLRVSPLQKCPGAQAPAESCYLELPPTGTSDDAVRSYGQAVAGLGNLEGAGRPHFAVGAADLCLNSGRKGKVFVYGVTGTRPNVTANLVSTLVGERVGDHFGVSVCGVGDVTGDGAPDVLVGANRAGLNLPGRAFLFYGGLKPDGTPRISGTLDLEMLAGGAATDDGIVPIKFTTGSDRFGSSCARTGDLDGDGTRDFAIAAPVGLRVYALRGRANLDASPPSAADVVLPPLVNPGYSFAQPGELAGGFDLDGDGRPDLVVGDTTRVFVFRGDAAGLVDASAPMIVFDLGASVGTGYPVVVLPNWRDQSGESGLPDVGIGRVSGSGLIVRY